MSDYRPPWPQDAPHIITQCVYCGRGLSLATVTWDHIIPKSRGGLRGKINTAPSCRSCNSAKGAMTVAEFLAERSDT